MPSAPLEPKWKQQFRARMGVPAAAAEYSAADNDEESSPPPPPPPATSDADDVIIPDDIARPLVYSSWLLFATSVAAGLRGEAGLSLVTFLVFVTSILHWSSPRFSSWRRYADYFAVVFAIAFASWLASYRTVSDFWRLLWYYGSASLGLDTQTCLPPQRCW